MGKGSGLGDAERVGDLLIYRWWGYCPISPFATDFEEISCGTFDKANSNDRRRPFKEGPL
jgi:hypothetical protein